MQPPDPNVPVYQIVLVEFTAREADQFRYRFRLEDQFGNLRTGFADYAYLNTEANTTTSFTDDAVFDIVFQDAGSDGFQILGVGGPDVAVLAIIVEDWRVVCDEYLGRSLADVGAIVYPPCPSDV